jgi:hypothetical protein
MRALVDLPSTQNHIAVSGTAEKHLIDLLKPVQPPHVPLAKDELRLIRFELAICNGEISVTLTNELLDEVGDDYSGILLLGATDAAAEIYDRQRKTYGHLRQAADSSE